ncbi:MAG: SHOCT domain-containing protein [Bacilli bacterium]|nr:SHOCT domain-containing protein [Bacilli bacterium]
MKIYRIIKSSLLALFTALLLVCALIPAMTYVSGSGTYATEVKISLFDLFSLNTMLGITSASSSSSSPLYGVLVLIIIFAGPLFMVPENKAFKLVGAATTFATFAMAENCLVGASQVAKQAGTTANFGYGGLIFWFITEIFVLILVLADLYVAFLHERFMDLIQKNSGGKRDTMALLKENKDMLEAGLITKEEFEERRASILKGE